MLDADLQLIFEDFHAEQVLPERMDELWATGWRHFGTHFVRYSLGIYGFDVRRVIPLRIRLADLSLSKSQRRTLRRNTDLRTVVGRLHITKEAEHIFGLHKERFSESIPESIYNFVSPDAATSPCETMQLSVFDGSRLVAESYFDLGKTAASGVYAMFDPEYSGRGLGVFTLLKEVEYAIETGRRYYYLGYGYEGSSFYDYKKRFLATEAFDWVDKWEPYVNRSGSDRGEERGRSPDVSAERSRQKQHP
jgi:arginine-tRNA-protein transferase